MTVRERIKKAKRAGENPWPELIDDWLSSTLGTMIELAEEVADEMGDSAARMSNNVYHWHRGLRQPTGMRGEALAKVLADVLEPQSGLKSEAEES